MPVIKTEGGGGCMRLQILDRENSLCLRGARVHPLHAKVSASLRLAITGKRLMLCNTVQYSATLNVWLFIDCIEEKIMPNLSDTRMSNT
jgi:hypothetical protein